jgi:hypothetical protein
VLFFRDFVLVRADKWSENGGASDSGHREATVQHKRTRESWGLSSVAVCQSIVGGYVRSSGGDHPDGERVQTHCVRTCTLPNAIMGVSFFF